jgi:hypothetical protein
MSLTTSEGAEWLKAYDARADEAAILARQNVKIAACVEAAKLILQSPAAGEHKIKDSAHQVRHQTVPLEVEDGRQIVIGKAFKAPEMSVRTFIRGLADRRTLLFQLDEVYSRELIEGGDPNPDGTPAEGRPDAGVLPVQGIKPFRVPPEDIDGSFRVIPYTEDNIARFSDHVTAVAATLDIELPTGNEIVGVTQARRLG